MSKKYQVVEGDTRWGLAERFYGDGLLYPVIGSHILVGQMLEIPDVTFRHRVAAGDTKQKLAVRYYHDETMSEVFEIPNDVAQRDLIVGEWLVIPDLANAGQHTVALGETWEELADRWYGEAYLWRIIAIANQMMNQDLQPGQVLIQPRLNRRRTVVSGDTLWKLTRDNYGDHGDGRTLDLMTLVSAANHIADWNHITVGQTIYFPSLD
ncbi:MAG TPA: LysM peptidoglycan-binding domain-containing protein [Mycobacterium sp.]|nr:LysM peptidoglycan-binding domain-containing protein [Mycobacterium sp.]HTX98107.1 LysM peptidoglycan-binding domain-containing protein [Mycobacterium sp.]